MQENTMNNFGPLRHIQNDVGNENKLIVAISS